MRSEHRQWIAYSISVVLLLCLAFYLAVTLDGRANAAGEPERTRIASPAKDDVPLALTPQALPLKTSAAVTSAVPAAAVVTPHAALAAAPEKIAPSVADPLTNTGTEAPPAPPAQEESKRFTYETTAYYLNVREEPSARAKILDVLERGTIIDVLGTTDNGWLRLADGGYVHGGYAKQLKEGVVRIASLGTVAGQAAKAASDSPDEADAAARDPAVSRNGGEDDDGEPNKPSSKVASDSGLSLEDIDTILAGTALADEGLEQAILEVEEEYGINAYFTIAVMKLESGNGESKIARKKNNLFGLNAIAGDAYNQALSFKTKADCVRKFGQLIADKYVGKGYTTIEKVARKYCPANSRWPGHVKDIMAKDYKLL